MKNKMTVRDLANILKAYDENDIVEIYSSGGLCWDEEWSSASLYINDDEVMEVSDLNEKED